jgi:hypothetical protein
VTPAPTDEPQPTTGNGAASNASVRRPKQRHPRGARPAERSFPCRATAAQSQGAHFVDFRLFQSGLDDASSGTRAGRSVHRRVALRAGPTRSARAYVTPR